MSRTLFYEDDDMRVSFELLYDRLFIHVTLNKFNKTVLRHMKEIWWEFRCRAWFDGFSEIFTYTKDDRVPRLVGHAHEVGQDDKSLQEAGVRMFRWDLIQQA